MQLNTERLRLRPRTLVDAEDCYQLDQQPGVLDYVSGPWHDPEAHRAFIHQRTVQDYGEGLGYWVVSPAGEPDQFLGWVLLIPVDGIGPEIEIGWRLLPRSWGKGIASEAARAVMNHAFQHLRLERVIADIHPDNQRSKRVARKIGMISTLQQPGDYERFEIDQAQFFNI
ncbi:GNAT family N-acetyltransferase [Saccharospirillum sp. HFRX-1]|uniref:GNAT family N-acetyltransferase n=1 Tax=unclassified Saccharospirillum TaxID=2633430 RepID=UPI00371FB7F6